jgi:hypothetical protein
MSRRVSARCLPLLAVPLLSTAIEPLHAQFRPTVLDRIESAVVPATTTVRFAEPVPLDSLFVTAVRQFYMPATVRWAASDRVVVDVATALVHSAIETDAADGRLARHQLSGLADVRVRAVLHVVKDRLLVTALANLPSGPTGLDEAQERVLRVVGSPALRPPVGVAGLGLGANAGLVWAIPRAGWSWALGASYEHRGRYSPSDVAVFGIPTRTELLPGRVLRASLAADRLVGEGRLSLVAAVETFGPDSLRFAQSGAAPDSLLAAGRIQLGPQATLGIEWAPGWRRVAESRLYAVSRLRAPFINLRAESQDGSAGAILDVGAEGVLGASDGVGLVVRVASRLDSGLSFDPTLLTAASTDVTGTLGVRVPVSRVVLQPEVSLRRGRIDLGDLSTTVSGVTISLALRSR